jgi:mannose-1-phosphate guanylyltransferase/mannose-6-phosphate isomerase
MLQSIKPIILAGGIGSRAGTTAANPKQFIQKTGQKSLYQQAIHRTSSMQSPLVMTNILYEDFIKVQTTSPYQTYYEPLGRNTAAAIVIAAMRLRDDGHDIALSLPSDHVIHDVNMFESNVKKAYQYLSNHDYGVLFGIRPSHPSTQYGYIQTDYFGNIVNFIEKPPLTKAQKLLKESAHTYWNSGLFLFRIATILDRAKEIDSHFYNLCNIAYKNPTLSNYELVPFLSFDELFMEQSHHLFCVEAEFDWCDVGNEIMVQAV